MAKRAVQAWWLLFCALCVVFAGFCVDSNEQIYPWGTQVASYADFSQTTLRKEDVAAHLASAAQNTPSGYFLLTKTDPGDAANGLSITWFGNEPEEAENTAFQSNQPEWFHNGRHATVRSWQDLGLSNLSGSYSFADEQTAAAFAQATGELNATVQPRGRRSPIAGVTEAVANNVGVLFLAASLVSLTFVVVWTWAGSRRNLNSVRIVNGDSPTVLVRASFVSMIRMAAIPAAISTIASFIIVSASHSWHAWAEFATTSVAIIAALIIIAAVLTLLFSLAFIPKVREIASRKDLSTRIRRGDGAFSWLCVFLALLSIPLSASAYAESGDILKDAEVWLNAQDAVTFDIQPSYNDGTHDKAFAKFFERAQDDNIMALSYSVGSMMVSSEGAPPTDEQIIQQLQPFEDVIITNSTFLDLLKVNTASMSPIDADSLPKGIQDSLNDYDGLWFMHPDGDATPYKLYTWQGSQAFPALLHSPNPGDIKTVHHPLLLVFDDAAHGLSTVNFLEAALTSGNIVFTDLPSAEKIIDEEGLDGVFYSASTVSDAAIDAAKRKRNEMTVDIASAICALCTALYCIGESARIWSWQHMREIFLRHTSGVAYPRICARHFIPRIIIQLVITLAVMTLCTKVFAQTQGIDAMIAVSCALMAIETCACMLYAKAAFRDVIMRRSD
ncbi:hypothetical protein [Pseudoscardovia suis]|uniref:Lantibiotic ABC transporter permease n=1 Tax=Pseudoscardovia suis TaxID=987063 RepID=A0A261ER75_9BIFI|nr:hypothetical protein [Pseudoscardovia suis]OZG49351.1 lantibiotic ABC transporter permease [Pseudoscardovia suis]PJJ65985.1 hypothetical protein CLV65_1237 [Pseudoscardovia suis]